MIKRLGAVVLILAVGLLIAPPQTLIPAAHAHGWISNPPSRADACQQGTVNFDCGGLQYEPQSVEAPHGSTKCSGGSRFSVVDDNSLPWPRTTVDPTVTLTWQITASHSTSTWEYFVDGELVKTVDSAGAAPSSTVEHTLTGLPAGDHLIFARWNIADTPNTFYQCIDVTVRGNAQQDEPSDADSEASETQADKTSTTKKADANKDQTDQCRASHWKATRIYSGATEVAFVGKVYRSRWPTYASPATGGLWSAWSTVGRC